MRLAELHLVAYGALGGTRLAFPSASPDLHLVMGPNAAGKSTLRQALRDALFGIPERTEMGFDVPRADLRIGFAVERGGRTFRAIRRKGRVRTLQDEQGREVDAGPLLDWLAGTTHERYERAFALDDVRLRQGGEAILKGQDDLSGLLFAASSGIDRLGQALERLAADAQAAWSADGRKVTRARQAEERLKKAERALKEHRVQARTFRALRAAVADAEAAVSAARGRRDQLRERAQRVELALRVLEPLARLDRARRARAALGAVPLLPVDAGELLRRATERIARAEAVLDAGRRRRAELAAACAALPAHEPILANRQRVEAFLERAAIVARQAAERPAVLAEIRAAEDGIRRALGEAGITAADPELALPPVTLVARLDGLLTAQEDRARQRAVLEARRRLAAAALSEAQAAVAALPVAPDPDALAVARAELAGWRAAGLDVEALAATADAANAALGDALDRLAPWRGCADALSIGDLPTPELEARLRADDAELARHLDRLAEQVTALHAERDRLAAERAGLAAAPDLVEARTLALARDHRDTLWAAFRDGALAPSGSPPTPAAAAAVTAAIVEADRLADARLARAERVHRLEAIDARLVAVEDEVTRATHARAAAAGERNEVAAAWAAATARTPLAGVGLDRAAAWRDDLDAALRARARQREAASTAARARARRDEVRATLVAALAQAGIEVPPEAGLDRLGALLERAVTTAAEGTAAARERRRAAELAAAELGRIDQAGADLERAWTEGAATLAAAAAAVGLPPGLDLVVLRAASRSLHDAHRHADTARDLRQRRLVAGEIEAEALAALARELAGDLGIPSSDPAALKAFLLGERDRAMARQSQRETLVAEIARLDRSLAEEETARRDALAALAPLRNVVGSDEGAVLAATAAASDQRHALDDEIARQEDALVRLAPGRDEASLRGLVDGRDDLALQAEADRLGVALAEADAEVEQRTEELTRSRTELARIDGADTAAALEAERQEAAAAMAHAVEDHLETLITARLVRRALDDYRAANETPLLRRASALFADLTLGEFARLVVDHDEDPAALVGVRPTGQRVGRGGMSAGTRDQLYLALRLAAVELHLDHAPPLPFVADDLLVQFSDDRAAAGLRALADLARRTQVLVFTHHRHLVDLATATLGAGGLVVHHLDGPARRGALAG